MIDGSPSTPVEPGVLERRFWLGSGFASGFVLTASLAAAILGIGLNIQLGSSGQAADSNVIGLVLGERIYNTNCAACHGVSGEGGVGPAIGDGVLVETYPFLSRHVAVITNGRGAMPSFSTTLTAEEIEAVALYEREKLGQ